MTSLSWRECPKHACDALGARANISQGCAMRVLLSAADPARTGLSVLMPVPCEQVQVLLGQHRGGKGLGLS